MLNSDTYHPRPECGAHGFENEMELWPGRRATAALFVVLLSSCHAYDSALLKRASATPDVDAGEQVVGHCGDGTLDDDELCDTAIAEGKVGSCPTECTSEDKCVFITATGDGCQRECVSLQVQRAINGDGCCPTGIGPEADSDCGTCGDGIIGPAETCEPASNCITQAACGTTAACLRSTLVGDPERCTSSCRLDLINVCKNDDGCCPAMCDAESDNDCSATCGNKIVEPENLETCEPESTTTPCPTNCDDEIACTMDVIAGTPQQCNVTCSHVPITTPASGDGCCPSGASSLNDDDCLPVCGNHVVESGEACDPCPGDCDDHDACTTDASSGSGCNVVCSHTPISAPAGGDSCCPSGANANNDSDCAPNCGNAVLEAGEACDGGGRCNASCQLVLPSSLVHRYSFEGTGTTAIDSVGNANGTIVNTSLTGKGRVSLSGSNNQYVDLPNGIISALTDISIETWYSWQGGANSHHVFDFGMNSAGEGNSSGTGTYYFYLNPTDGMGQMVVGMNFTAAGNDYAIADYQLRVTPPSTGGRHHIVITYHDPGAGSAKTLELYLDGAQAGSISVAASVSSTNNRLSSLDDRNEWIGRSNYSTSTFAGSIEEFRIYNVALSAAAVSANTGVGPDP